MPYTNEEGCICSETTPADCYWSKCKLKCRTCPENPSMCDPPPPTPTTGGWGDVHFSTFDKRQYDFHGVGEYTFCMDEPNGFGIQIRSMWPQNVYGVSILGGIAVKVGQTKITVFMQRNGTYTVRIDGRIFDTHSLPLTYTSDNYVVWINRESMSIERPFYVSLNAMFVKSYAMSVYFSLLTTPYLFERFASRFQV